MLFMFAAATAAADSAPFEPALLAVLSIFGGAALTAGAGFFGAWVQSRREHERWLREQRFDAFTSATELISRISSLQNSFLRPTTLDKRLREVNDATPESIKQKYLADTAEVIGEIDRVFAPIRVLGPDNIKDALADAVTALSDDDKAVRDAARRRATALM